MESHAMDRVKKLFYTAAYITLNELAHIQCQNSGTAASQLWCKSSLGSTYFNDKSCKVLQSIIAGVLEDDLQKLLTADGELFSVLSDGATDRSVTEKEIVYIRVVE